MNSVVRLAIAVVVASVAPLLALTALLVVTVPGHLDGLEFILAVAWLVCLIHLIVLGVPALVLLSRRGAIRGRTICLLGFLAGALPLGLMGFPTTSNGYSSGGTWHGRYVDFYQHGEPTKYAWLSHIESSLLWGAYGVIAAVVLWRVWLALGRFAAPRATGA